MHFYILYLLLCNLSVNLVVGTTQRRAAGNNLFTAAAFKEAIKSGEENLLISPLSAEIVLALTQSGAKDETAREIQSALHLSHSDNETKTIFKELLQNLKGNEHYALHTANKIYVGKNFAIKDQFKSVASTNYVAEIENIDFSQSEQAANTINQWVEKQTEHKIKNLVDKNSINGGTPATIVNALYFKAKWFDTDFHKYGLGKQDFYKSLTDVVKVDTMSNIGALLNYYEDAEIGATFLQLPFEERQAHIVLVLPNAKDGLANVEKQADKIFKSHPFKQEIVDVTIPLFKIESTVDFKKILQQLGVKKAFKPGEADFSGIAGNKGELAIEGVLQKTYINVNQDGVEAAAATNLLFAVSGPPRATKTFKADHPFLFYITVKDVILFAGKVTSPSH